MEIFVRNIRNKIVEVEVTGRTRPHFRIEFRTSLRIFVSNQKNGAKDEGRSNNQLRVRAQALQPERSGPLDEEVLRGGGV